MSPGSYRVAIRVAIRVDIGLPDMWKCRNGKHTAKCSKIVIYLPRSVIPIDSNKKIENKNKNTISTVPTQTVAIKHPILTQVSTIIENKGNNFKQIDSPPSVTAYPPRDHKKNPYE